jgi:hypothetical protein
VYTSQGVPLASGELWVEALSPVSSDEEFIPPDDVSVTITDGEFTLSLASGCVYDFTIRDEMLNRLWSFQSEVPAESSDPISISELFANRR